MDAHAQPSRENDAQAATATQENPCGRTQAATAAEGQALKRAAELISQDQTPANKRTRVEPLEGREAGDTALAGAVPAAPAAQQEAKRVRRKKATASGTAASLRADCSGHLRAAKEEAAALGEALAAWPCLEKLPERLATVRSEMKRAEVNTLSFIKLRGLIEGICFILLQQRCPRTASQEFSLGAAVCPSNIAHSH